MANRIKMSRAERAKQFMPFAALKGYAKALKEKEDSLGKRQNVDKDKYK